MQLMTVGTLVARDTGSALRTGLVAVATFSPQIITSPMGGALADRYDRRQVLRVLLALQTVGACILAIAIARGHSPLVLTLIVAGQGLISSMANPVVGAITPDLVPSNSLLAAASLNSVSWNTGRIAGPVLATALINTVGPAYCIAANAVSFAVLFATLSMLKRDFPPAATDIHETIWHRLRQGYRALRSAPTVQFAWWVACANQAVLAPIIGLIPIIATKRLQGGPGLVSALFVAFGIGSLGGSWMVTAVVRRFGRARTGFGLNAIAVLLFLITAQLEWIPLVVLLFAPMGTCFIGGFVSIHSVIQRDAPAAERGRILSIVGATIGLSYSVGVLWMGSLADARSIHTALTTSALLGVGILGASLVLLRGRWAALGHAD